MNTHSKPLGIRKLRVAQLQGLVARAAYQAGAHPECQFALSMEVLETRRFGIRHRHEIKAALRFAVDALSLIHDASDAGPDLFQRFVAQVQTDTDGQLTVGAAARYLDVSPYQVSRVVRQTAGRSSSAYMKMARLERAPELLATSRVTEACFPIEFGKWFVYPFCPAHITEKRLEH